MSVKKFIISGIKEYLEEIITEDNIYYKYGIYLKKSGNKFDKNLFNDKISLINFLKKNNMEIKTKIKKWIGNTPLFMLIAEPLANEKQLEMINKIIKNKESICSGIKACTKEIMKEKKGIIILTGDTTPMDLITHIPALCEEKGVKYLFVEKKSMIDNSYTCIFLDKESSSDLYDSLK